MLPTLLVSIQTHSAVAGARRVMTVCEQELCMCVCVCLCVLCHLWAALVDFIWSHKICIACVFMAQQTRSTDTDTAGDTDTDTNTVAKCDRVLSCWARQLPNWFSKPRKAREEAPCRFGAAIKSYLNYRPGGRREGRQVWLAVPLKIKPNGEGQGESAGEKTAEGSRETGWWRWRWAAANKKVKGGRGSAAATSCSGAGLYKHDLSNWHPTVCVCPCVGELAGCHLFLMLFIFRHAACGRSTVFYLPRA